MATPLSEENIKRLRKLPAVKNVTKHGRIYYTQEFQKHFLEEHAKGAKPVNLFREAGLGPEIIGYKRIERATARWSEKAEKQENLG